VALKIFYGLNHLWPLLAVTLMCHFIGNKRLIQRQMVAVANAEILMYNTMPLYDIARSPRIYITVSGAALCIRSDVISLS